MAKTNATKTITDTTTTNPTPAQAQQATDPLAGLTFHQPKQSKAKADPNRPKCAEDGCKLYPSQNAADPTRCINHQPAVSRLTRDEAEALLAYLDAITPAERLSLVVNAMGWYKAKELVKQMSAVDELPAA